MRRYTLKDYGAEMGMTSREVAAYRRQCAWNKKMAAILKPTTKIKEQSELDSAEAGEKEGNG